MRGSVDAMVSIVFGSMSEVGSVDAMVSIVFDRWFVRIGEIVEVDWIDRTVFLIVSDRSDCSSDRSGRSWVRFNRS